MNISALNTFLNLLASVAVGGVTGYIVALNASKAQSASLTGRVESLEKVNSALSKKEEKDIFLCLEYVKSVARENDERFSWIRPHLNHALRVMKAGEDSMWITEADIAESRGLFGPEDEESEQ